MSVADLTNVASEGEGALGGGTSVRLWSITLMIILGVWSSCRAQPAKAGQDSRGPTALKAQAVVFPAYDSYPGIWRYAPKPEDYARAIADTEFVMERVTYRSDDLEVFAYLYRPTVPPKHEKLPVVIFNRGSYVRSDFSPEVLMLGGRLARQGFVVVAPMLRGSGGAPGHDEMGGADLHDLFNIVAVLRQLEYADTSKVFLYGESRGGVMCLLAAKHGFPARALAIYGTITDFGLFLGEGTPARKMASQIWPGFLANEVEITEPRSAVRWPDRINTPALLMHGANDGDVSPLNAIELAAALQRLGKPYELKIFYGEKHVLAGRATERDEEAVRWFRRFEVSPHGPTKP
jgi:dipeptidyl aminopeptidase/acylaminoacyl peptidase